VTIHESALARMQKEGMVNLAAETLRIALAQAEEELAESRADVAAELTRIHEDELYIAQLEQRVAALRARLGQLEAAPAFGVIPPHGQELHPPA